MDEDIVEKAEAYVAPMSPGATVTSQGGWASGSMVSSL
jgi:hypothetical protein